MLSRFASAKEQKATLDGLAAGTVDLVVGTHRLLSKDVAFKNLGLVVVDEEHRFGVAHKERLKQLRTAVDVLTLSATPIPRTLEMAITGIRDLSVIETPPEERQPVVTHVGEWDPAQAALAVRRELLREGQVFWVHNQVQTIDAAAEQVQQLIPNARVRVGHGQMPEGQLEKLMLDFWHREFDVLVCTTIIESGLDIPNANTLIVERADLLGLAQLHQLRGRVGRSAVRGYAYLFHPEQRALTEEAYKRLEGIATHTALGSGMSIALADLEIRGAGSLLGADQSGHVAAVGFEAYSRAHGRGRDRAHPRQARRARARALRRPAGRRPPAQGLARPTRPCAWRPTARSPRSVTPPASRRSAPSWSTATAPCPRPPSVSSPSPPSRPRCAAGASPRSPRPPAARSASPRCASPTPSRSAWSAPSDGPAGPPTAASSSCRCHRPAPTWSAGSPRPSPRCWAADRHPYTCGPCDSCACSASSASRWRCRRASPATRDWRPAWASRGSPWTEAGGPLHRVHAHPRVRASADLRSRERAGAGRRHGGRQLGGRAAAAGGRDAAGRRGHRRRGHARRWSCRSSSSSGRRRRSTSCSSSRASPRRPSGSSCARTCCASSWRRRSSPGSRSSEADIEAAYEANFAVPGVRAIVTQTEEEAQDALDRIEGGEDFAAVAAEVSIDSSGQQGGEVGVARARRVPARAAGRAGGRGGRRPGRPAAAAGRLRDRRAGDAAVARGRPRPDRVHAARPAGHPGDPGVHRPALRGRRRAW